MRILYIKSNIENVIYIILLFYLKWKTLFTCLFCIFIVFEEHLGNKNI